MEVDPDRDRMLEAIAAASDEVGLPAWSRACVEPLMRLEEARFPACCGAGCEPCNATLVEVAIRARRRLASAAGSAAGDGPDPS